MAVAVVTDLQREQDDAVRSAVIRTSNGVTTRPIVKLYLLEVNVEMNTPETDSSIVLDTKEDSSPITCKKHPHDLPDQQRLRLEVTNLTGLRSCGARRMSRTMSRTNSMQCIFRIILCACVLHNVCTVCYCIFPRSCNLKNSCANAPTHA